MTELSATSNASTRPGPLLVSIPQNEAEYDLLVTQLNFGWTYANEARLAFEAGRSDYGSLSLGIAINAHSTVLRFTWRLPSDARRIFQKEIARLRAEIGRLQQQSSSARPIA